MKASELRIGNWVNQLGFDNDTIISIDDMFETVSTNSMMDRPIDDFNHIPLTEEWLIKFDFDNNFKQFDFENNGLKVIKDVHSDSWICYIGFLNQFNEICIIKYVHQLQNLYFALTGGELN